MDLYKLCNNNTTLNEVKEWFKEELDKCHILEMPSTYSDNYGYGCHRRSNTYESTCIDYFYDCEKYDIVEYLIKLGAGFEEKHLLSISNIETILLHHKFENFREEYATNCAILQYLIINSNKYTEKFNETMITSMSKVFRQCYVENSIVLEFIIENFDKFTSSYLVEVVKHTKSYKRKLVLFDKFKDKFNANIVHDILILCMQMDNIDKSELFEQLNFIKYLATNYTQEKKIVIRYNNNIYYMKTDFLGKSHSIRVPVDDAKNKIIDLALDYNLIELNDLQMPFYGFAILNNLDIDIFKKIKNLGGNINQKINDYSYLFYCTNAEQTNFFLENGIDAKYVSSSNTTPLFTVVNAKQVRLLLDADIDSSIKSKNGNTAQECYETLYEQSTKHSYGYSYYYDNQTNILQSIIDEFKKNSSQFVLPDAEAKVADTSNEELINLLKSRGVNINVNV